MYTVVALVYSNIMENLPQAKRIKHSDTAAEILQQWLVKHNVQMPKVEIATTDDGIGVFATEDLSAQDLIGQVPKKVVIIPDVVRQSCIAQDMKQVYFQQYEEEPPYRPLLYAFLIQQRSDADSLWHDYLVSIPELIPSPIIWTEDELRILQGTNLGAHVAEEVTKLRNLYETTLNLLATNNETKYPASIYNWDAFIWAHLACTSRSFPLQLSQAPDGSTEPLVYYLSSSGITCSTNPPNASSNNIVHIESPTADCIMLPFCDALNHSHNASLMWVATASDISFVANEVIKKGAQIYNNYGPKSNEELLLAYGFSLEENPHDKVALKIKLDPSREQLLKEQELELLHLLTGKELPDSFLAVLRIASLQPEQLWSALHSSQYNSRIAGGLRTEAVMLESLDMLIRQKHRAATTALFRIDKDYDKGHLGSLAAPYCRGQQKICTKIIEQVESKVRALRVELPTCRMRVRASDTDSRTRGFLQRCFAERDDGLVYSSVIARKPIPSGSVLEFFDMHQLITLETVFESATFGDAAGALEGVEDEVLLALFLLHEYSKGENSEWGVFLHTMRHAEWWQLATIHWSEDELAFLSGTPLLEETLEQREIMEDLYADLFPVLTQSIPEIFIEDAYTYDFFQWIMTVVGAYTHRISGVLCIVPTCERPRFDPIASSAFAFVPEKYGLEWYTKMSLQAGEEITYHYGLNANEGNTTLLLWNGIVANDCGLPGSMSDTVPIGLDRLLNGDQDQLDVLEQHDIPIECTLTLTDPLPNCLLAAAKTLYPDEHGRNNGLLKTILDKRNLLHATVENDSTDCTALHQKRVKLAKAYVEGVRNVLNAFEVATADHV